MADVQTLTELFTKIGGMDDSIGTVLRTAHDAWMVRFENADVEIEFEEAEDRLIFACSIGPVPTESRAEILEALLAYSFLWRSTGGVHIALSEVGGDALQVYTMAAQKASAERLLAIVLNLAANSQVWRAFFASKAIGDVAVSPPDAGQMIRV